MALPLDFGSCFQFNVLFEPGRPSNSLSNPLVSAKYCIYQHEYCTMMQCHIVTYFLCAPLKMADGWMAVPSVDTHEVRAPLSAATSP